MFRRKMIGLFLGVAVIGVCFSGLNTKAADTGLFGGYITSGINMYGSNLTGEAADYAKIYREAAYRKPVGSPLENEISDENYIDPLTGEVIIRRTDMSLSGAGGFDFSLDRYYSNRNAAVNMPRIYKPSGGVSSEYSSFSIKVEISYLGGQQIDLVVPAAVYIENQEYINANYKVVSIVSQAGTKTKEYDVALVTNILNGPYTIGVGWAYDFPWVETVFDGSNLVANDKTSTYLHLGSTGTWQADFQNSNSGLKGYDYQDIRFRESTTDDKKINALAYFTMESKDGETTYFNSVGKIIEKRDANGNKITFSYENAYQSGKLTEITDTAQRKINFNYNGDMLTSAVINEPSGSGQTKMEAVYKVTKQTFKTKKLDGVTTKEVTYSSNVLEWVTVDDDTEKYTYSELDSKNSKAAPALLNIVNDADKKGSNKGGYNSVASIFGANTKGILYYNLLSTQTNEDSKQIFNYYVNNKHCGNDGTMQYYGVKETYETFNSIVQNKVVYERASQGTSTAYDGYPYINNNEIHYTNITDDTYSDADNKSTREEILFSPDNSLKERINKKGVGKSYVFVDKTQYEYTGTLPKSTVTYTYANNDYNKYTKAREEYTYDNYRNILTQVKPEAFSDTGERKYLYTEINTYYYNEKAQSVLKDRSYYIDEGVQVREENTLTGDKFNIAKTIMKENDKEVGKTAYSYERGNITYEYEYVDYVNNKNQYIEKQYIYDAKGVNILVDITHNYMSGLSGGSIVNRISTYDYFDNELTSKDGNLIQEANEYDANTGELKKTISAVETNQETFETYVEKNRINTITDEDGLQTITYYDQFENVWKETDDKAGTWTEFTYDKNGLNTSQSTYVLNPSRTQGSLISKSINNYDINNKLISTAATDRRGKVVSWTLYKDFVEKVTLDGKDAYATASYTKVADPAGYGSSITYDNAGALKEEISTQYQDENGKVLKSVSRKNKGTDYIEVTNKNTLNVAGQIKCTETTTDRNGIKKKIIQEYTYDYMGRQKEVSQKDEAGTLISKEKNEYNSLGWIVRSYDAKGMTANYWTDYEYDIMGNVVKKTTPVNENQSSVTTTQYDSNGNMIGESQVSAGVEEYTTYEYDAMNRLIKVVNYPEGKNSAKRQYTQYFYDNQGNKTRMYTGLSDPLTISISKSPGSNGEAYPFYAPTSTKLYFIFTTEGSDKEYNVTKYEYNYKGQLVKTIDPEKREETYEYDEYGNLKTKTDKNKNTITNTYDDQNRLKTSAATSYDNKGTTTHTYTYNILNELQSKDNTQYTYDTLNGVAKETQTNSGGKTIEKQYTYNGYGQKVSFEVSIGGTNVMTQGYQYDGLNRLSKVTGDSGESVVAYTQYDENGNREKEDRGIYKIEYGYDRANQLTKMSNLYNSSANYMAQSQYTYYGPGQIATMKQAFSGKGEAETKYDYDYMGRLIKEEKVGGEKTEYEYKDDQNNRTKKTASGKETSYTYNRNDELLKEVTGTQTTEYYYDANGNQLSGITSTGGADSGSKESMGVNLIGGNASSENTYSQYNPLNQLIQSKVKDKKVAYEYDADGLRVSKTVNGTVTRYVWDGNQLALELDQQYNIKKRYVRGLDAVYSDNGKGTAKTYYVYNGHGDVVQLVDGNAVFKKANAYEYDAFGNELNLDTNDDNPFRYCGEYYDKETGFDLLPSYKNNKKMRGQRILKDYCRWQNIIKENNN